MKFYYGLVHPKDADRMANSADPDQAAPLPLGAVSSRSTLIAQTCLSKNKGSLRYFKCVHNSTSERQKSTVKLLNIFGHPKNCCNYPKIQTMWLYHRIMLPKNADRMANSVDPDQV